MGGRWVGAALGPAQRPLGLCLAAILPGRTALLLAAAPGVESVEEPAQVAAVRGVLGRLRAADVTHAQALLDPDDDVRRRMLERSGLAFLTTLDYCERDAQFPWSAAPLPTEATWLPYRPELHARFIAVIGQSYEATADCPELGALRSVEDALAGHRRVGVFDPALWQIAIHENQDAGVLLLAQHPATSAAEVVYCGVVAAHRGRGVGRLLLRRALDLTRTAHLRRITLVVDSRNSPARRLYDAFAFQTTAVRAALIIPAAAFPEEAA